MNLKHDYIQFKNEIETRGIEFLIHFTPTINLYSILNHKKLISRDLLENLDIAKFDIMEYAKFSDDMRYDDKKYINLSISSPNTVLLNTFMKKSSNDITIQWCILKINPKYIYERNTLFSLTNAASYSAKNIFGINGDFNQFKNMFIDKLEYNARIFNRYEIDIAAKYPTDIQAEVLVKDIIKSNDIIEVCFESEDDLAQAKAAMSEYNTSNFVIDKKIFNPNRQKGT